MTAHTTVFHMWWIEERLDHQVPVGQARHKGLAAKNLLCFQHACRWCECVVATVAVGHDPQTLLVWWQKPWIGLVETRASGRTYQGFKENHFKCSVYVCACMCVWTMSCHTHIIYNPIKVTRAPRTSTAKTAHTHTNTRTHAHTYKHIHWHTLPRERQSERDTHIDNVYL